MALIPIITSLALLHHVVVSPVTIQPAAVYDASNSLVPKLGHTIPHPPVVTALGA